MIHTIIVEDEPATARGLKLLLTSTYPDFEVVALCKNGKDGLEKITKHKPDLVIADIDMPVMDGLEMIRHAKESGSLAHFVILTGYSEFEYARKAIHLGVSDYLLKPITTANLDDIITSCRQYYHTTLRLLQTEYLKNNLNSKKPVTRDGSNPFSGTQTSFLFLFFGPIQSNIYNEGILLPESLTDCTPLLQRLGDLTPASILSLDGRHQNEQIYAVTAPSGSPLNIKKIAEEFYRALRPEASFLNLIITRPYDEHFLLPEIVQDVYLHVMTNLPYGYSSISRCAAAANQLTLVSPEVRKLCTSSLQNPDAETLLSFVQTLLGHWRQQKSSQLQIVSDLRYFFSTIVRNCTDEDRLYPDAAEIISNCQSYDDLEKDLFYEIKQLYHFQDENLPVSQKNLAKVVRNWLDNHFTEQITYKIFQDIFGYNEKYISALFKAEYGMSPNKYVGKLRLDMAKQLMQSNPNILLKDVAKIVGFTDAFYFSRVFKASEGISPNQYMRNRKDPDSSTDS